MHVNFFSYLGLFPEERFSGPELPSDRLQGPRYPVCSWLSVADFHLVRKTFCSLCADRGLPATAVEYVSQRGWVKAQAPQGIQEVGEGINIFPSP